MPTSYAAPPLRERVMAAANDVVPVWPDAEAQVRGEAWSPLYSKAVEACRRDPALYETLALVDAIRGGRARERSLAVDELKKRLS